MNPSHSLRRTWTPFFGGFGRLTAIQQRAIPALLAGKDAVLCSPTASGKTEAAVAPLIERGVPAGTEGPRILYVVPTRALVNDLVRRLEAPLRALRLQITAKTGDLPRIRPAEPAALLVTTPESLDSMLCRTPRLFSHLTAVILDELHLLDGTYRGDQLQILMRRLPDGLQRVACSATVHNPSRLAERYLGPDALLVTVGQPRGLRFEVTDTIEEAIGALKRQKRHKILVFANRRADVERLSVELGSVWPRERILAHHGSLSRRERESVERAMHEWRWGLCVATMTLEIGVDIGDVDAVILYGPPATPSAFQQRIGRACRREAEVVAIGVCQRPEDSESFRVLRAAAEDGQVEATGDVGDPSVMVQQLFSLLYGTPAGLTREALTELLAPLGGPDTLDRILTHLIDEEVIEPTRRDGVRAATRLMDMGEKGFIHSNIPGSRELKFRDAKTGRIVGVAQANVEVGDVVVFGGQTQRVVAKRGGDVQLERTQDASASSTAFRRRPSGGGFVRWLPSEMR